MDPYKNNASEQLYFGWLCNVISPVFNGHEYWRLLRALHDIPYSWSHPMDVNRCTDGLDLRDRFIDESNQDVYLEEDSCSVLEMLIGVARRMDDMLSEGIVNIEIFFWELVGNLNLLHMHDVNYYDAGGLDHVADIVHVFMNGQYARDGSGGLFPLKYSRKDQRKRDIWYQMNVYLEEMYYSG